MPDGTLTYQELYNLVSSSPNNKGMSFSDFQKKMSDPTNSKALYTALQGTSYKSRVQPQNPRFLEVCSPHTQQRNKICREESLYLLRQPQI
jgi:hypothetical protein